MARMANLKPADRQPSAKSAKSPTSATSGKQQWVLTLSCPDTPGIVHGVSSYLLVTGCTILDSQQYGDPDTGLFFMRVSFTRVSDDVTLEALNSGFEAIGHSFHMAWQFHDTAALMPVVLMVSKFGHCLNDLLFRASIGALPVRIEAVVSNHRDFEELTKSHGYDFVHLPVAQGDAIAKAAAEARLLDLVEERGVELVVLARYMQVLTDDACKALEGRMINIHHSFLPSFKGAKPYHQAHARGVKLIGATAHYVTADLDEGPIIEQEVARVGHGLTPEQLVAVGRDVECQALARAVKWHAEHRVLLNGHRTVVFP
jgi:formyltetrahydrofolate deformylase